MNLIVETMPVKQIIMGNPKQSIKNMYVCCIAMEKNTLMNSADMKDLVSHGRLMQWMTEGCRNTRSQEIKNTPQDVAV